MISREIRLLLLLLTYTFAWAESRHIQFGERYVFLSGGSQLVALDGGLSRDLSVLHGWQVYGGFSLRNEHKTEFFDKFIYFQLGPQGSVDNRIQFLIGPEIGQIIGNQTAYGVRVDIRKTYGLSFMLGLTADKSWSSTEQSKNLLAYIGWRF